MDHADDGLVEVGIVVDHDRVLAPHFGDHSLEVVLARLDFGRLAIDQEADVARAGKGDDVDIGMIDESLAGFLAKPGQVIEDARRQPGLVAARWRDAR